jgi:hypothetical protein
MPHRKCGFIDKKGTLVIPAQFDDVARDEYGGTFITKLFEISAKDCAPSGSVRNGAL